MTILAATLYFLGIFLHYLHLITVVAFTKPEGRRIEDADETEDADYRRVLLLSLAWPLMTCWYLWEIVLKGDDEDDEDN